MVRVQSRIKKSNENINPTRSPSTPRIIFTVLNRCWSASLSPSIRLTERALCRFSRSQAADQAKSQLALSEAGLLAAEAQYKQAQAVIEQSHQQVQQASHNVTTLKPLEGQLPGKQAAIDTAKYNLDNCRVVAPFDALVTNLTISQGAYATAGQHIFLVIHNRTWWVIANFRETQLHNIRPGMLQTFTSCRVPTFATKVWLRALDLASLLTATLWAIFLLPGFRMCSAL